MGKRLTEERGQVAEPAEDFGAGVVDVEVGEGAANGEGGDERKPGTAGGVGFQEKLGHGQYVMCIGECVLGVPLAPTRFVPDRPACASQRTQR